MMTRRERGACSGVGWARHGDEVRLSDVNRSEVQWGEVK